MHKILKWVGWYTVCPLWRLKVIFMLVGLIVSWLGMKRTFSVVHRWERVNRTPICETQDCINGVGRLGNSFIGKQLLVNTLFADDKNLCLSKFYTASQLFLYKHNLFTSGPSQSATFERFVKNKEQKIFVSVLPPSAFFSTFHTALLVQWCFSPSLFLLLYSFFSFFVVGVKE